MSSRPSIVWFRQDLRTEDNPALRAAHGRGGPVVPLYVWSPEEEGRWAPGGASRWWLSRSLSSLHEELSKLGSPLVVLRGESLPTIRGLASRLGAGAVFWNRRYEPEAVAVEEKVDSALRADGLTVGSFNAGLLFEPSEVSTKQGKPYRVFTPFWKACGSLPEPPEPLPAPEGLPAPAGRVESLSIGELGLEAPAGRAGGLSDWWSPGREGALALLERFVEDALPYYSERRDRPDLPGGSRLSPHLHFGEISPRQVWHLVRERAALEAGPSLNRSAEKFLRQLGWREFAHHLLVHWPRSPDHPLREEFADFQWRKDEAGLETWRRGLTGYPFVDAGMRELLHTGWMHNRARMVVASFLVKDLLVAWQEGAGWFWEKLVDADLANNTLGWQWSAGSGADAAPFFRVFNPVKQGERFDPEGEYVRRWVPELARLGPSRIHRPWETSSEEMKAAGVKLGRDYPKPVVGHGVARRRALAAWSSIKKKGSRSQAP